MKKSLPVWKRELVALLAAMLGLGTVRAATNHVAFGSNFFNPKTVTINVGDTVVWTNQGGSHSVTGTGSDPICGNTIGISSCTHTFNTAGTFPYVCLPHQSVGMTGVVIVLATTNLAPQVALTIPTNNAAYTAGADITLEAKASDSDGTVTKVEFFAGTDLVGAATTPPYTVTWTNVSAGNYNLTARASDNSGAAATSAAVSIMVTNGAPSAITLLSPAVNGTSLNFSIVTQIGISYTVQFTESLGALDWQVLTNFSGSGAVESVTDAAAGAQRFYRVSVP